MSKVYSFRLCADNPREAQAIEVIEAWASKGYSLRYTLVETIVLLNKEKNNSQNAGIEQILARLETQLCAKQNNYSPTIKDDELSRGPIQSIGKIMKTGMRVESE